MRMENRRPETVRKFWTNWLESCDNTAKTPASFIILARKRARAGNAKKAMMLETMEGMPTLKSVINWTLNFSGVFSFDTLLLTSVAMRSMRENSLLSLLAREFRLVSFLPVSVLIFVFNEEDTTSINIAGLEH